MCGSVQASLWRLSPSEEKVPLSLMMGYSCITALLCLSCGLLVSSYKIEAHEWDKLILTHQWPQTFCSMESCETNLTYWTIHGLWTNKGNMCNSSWHFNESQIQDLLPEMRKWWPDLLSSGPSATFWKHEWTKHGTCAAKEEAMNSEHKYFSKALDLYHKLDLSGVLTQAGIVPGENPYSLEKIEGVIVSVYSAKPKIQCTHLNGQMEQALGQIEICFDRAFQLTDCEGHEADVWGGLNDVLAYELDEWGGFGVCNSSMPVVYPPYKSAKQRGGGYLP
ncbi:ribonuclease T2 isoform X1 [Brienomyrus brachyistius]|uniref:ribonuclease T2 isoform X1 n=2 Tax=Brienomyrus brachyistius TaxID=42636 RepID=UPI0020B3F534|nr:ribonuclease T2 isoform X1 [Brienomyrus brachyistius]